MDSVIVRFLLVVVMVAAFLVGLAYLMKVSEDRRKAREKAQERVRQARERASHDYRSSLSEFPDIRIGPLSVAEGTLTPDEYRTERFEPFPWAFWHWQVLDDAFLATHEIGHVLVLDLTGRLVGVEASNAFSGRIRQLVEQGERTIVINLKGLTMVDAMGLGELARATVRLERAGGVMAVVNAPRHFRDLMAIIKSTGERVSVGPSTGGPART